MEGDDSAGTGERQVLKERISKQDWLESLFEKSLWNCRFVVLLAVVFGLISAIALFVLGAVEVVSGISSFCKGVGEAPPAQQVIQADEAQSADPESAGASAGAVAAAHGDKQAGAKEKQAGYKEKQAGYKATKVERGPKLVGTLIGAVDYFLIGVVLLIFSFGIYELFISHLEIGRLNKEVQILEITSLDDLKNRIIKVVIMVLIVSFFKKILSIEFVTPQDMLFFASSIFVLCLGVYFMHKSH